MNIWIVGVPITRDGEELGWMAEAAYLTEEEAVVSAKLGEFIICAKVGERFPDSANDAIKLYYPRHEKWEDSALFKSRTGEVEK